MHYELPGGFALTPFVEWSNEYGNKCGRARFSADPQARE